MNVSVENIEHPVDIDDGLVVLVDKVEEKVAFGDVDAAAARLVHPEAVDVDGRRCDVT